MDYELTEADTRATHVDPALQVAGWEPPRLILCRFASHLYSLLN